MFVNVVLGNCQISVTCASFDGRATGKLSYRPTGMLPAGTHTVEIVATGEQGRSTARKNWTFTVAQ
jgi:hypothetical protein